MTKFRRIAGAALILAMTAAAGCGTLRPAIYKGPVVTTPDACADLTASIYFARDSAALNNDAKAVLRGAAAQAESCNFKDVEIYGLSDPVGAPAANAALSKRRADVVTQELARLGFSEVTFKLVAAGEAGSVTPTGEVQPLRRRVDVIFGAR